MTDREIREAIELQVLLKAEQAGIDCNEENLPLFMELAKDVGAPFKKWRFIIEGNKIGVIQIG